MRKYIMRVVWIYGFFFFFIFFIWAVAYDGIRIANCMDTNTFDHCMKQVK